MNNDMTETETETARERERDSEGEGERHTERSLGQERRVEGEMVGLDIRCSKCSRLLVELLDGLNAEKEFPPGD